jgi:hypothetical protein
MSKFNPEKAKKSMQLARILDIKLVLPVSSLDRKFTIMALMDVTTEQLRRAVSLKEQIESLEQQLASLLGGGAGRVVGRGQAGGRGGRRTMSAAARARIAAAQRARWARQRGGGVGARAAGGPRKRRRMSPEARARIAAAQRARWARQRSG